MQPPARPIIYSAVGIIRRESCIYILRGMLTMQPPHGRSFTPASIKFAVQLHIHPGGYVPRDAASRGMLHREGRTPRDVYAIALQI